MLLRKTKLYTASKISHGPKWRNLRMLYPETIEFTARWLDLSGPDHNTTFWSEEQKCLHWLQDISDVRSSDFLLAYNEPDDAIKGTLVEIGAAIAFCIPVVAVGFESSHSWQSHPLVHPFSALPFAFDFILGRKTP